jgi:hypothetical protein
VEPNALVQQVLRESYLQTTEDLRYFAEKVRYLNRCKRAVREYLSALRRHSAKVRCAVRERAADGCGGDAQDLALQAAVIEEHAEAYAVSQIAREMGIPGRVPAERVGSIALLEQEIAHWEGRLAMIGDDAQLANVDLQNILQKQQQTLQMMSNISKTSHDTLLAIIRKMGG